MLLGLDEFPFHQTTDTFAAVAGSDPSWNDGHYVCAADQAGTVAFTSNVRLYANNDVLDGFVCLRHAGRQYNVRVSRRLRPDMEQLGAGPLRLEIVEPLETVRLVLDDNPIGIALDVTCHTANAPYMGPIEVRRLDGRLLSERATYEITGECEGGSRSAASGSTLDRDDAARSSATTRGATSRRAGRPTAHGAPAPEQAGARAAAMGAVPHARATAGFFFEDPSGRAAAGRGAILAGDRIVPVVDIATELEFHDGGRRFARGTFRLDRRRGASSATTSSRISAGSTARAAATSAASTTASARASTGATSTSRARSGTSATRRRSSTRPAVSSSSSTTGRRASPCSGTPARRASRTTSACRSASA